MARRDLDEFEIALAMCGRIGADLPVEPGDGGWRDRVSAFAPVGDMERAAKGWIDVLRVRPSGNFGNNYLQLLHALTVAEAAGIERVSHNFAWFDGGEPARDIRLVRRRMIPERQAGLEGAFFLKTNVRALREATPETFVRLSDEFLAPRLSVEPVEIAPVALNLRGGADIFENDAPNGRYGQPPLCFYQMALLHVLETFGEMAVAVVHQDERNPVLAPLVEWLTAEGIDARLLSGGAERDAAAILGARHLIMGVTTFADALAMMSPRLESATAFRHGPMEALLARKAPRFFRVEDAAGDYFGPMRWSNSDRQRRMMVEYPEEALDLVEAGVRLDLSASAREGRRLRRAARRRRKLASFGLTRP
ncbi:MAG: hypothetical protein AAFN79_05645 [Pseudomonadota bacterium]